MTTAEHFSFESEGPLCSARDHLIAALALLKSDDEKSIAAYRLADEALVDIKGLLDLFYGKPGEVQS